MVDGNQKAVAGAPAGIGASFGSPSVGDCAGWGDIRIVFQRFLSWSGAGRSVGPSDYKFGLEVDDLVQGADWDDFEIGTPDPGAALSIGTYGIGAIRGSEISIRLVCPLGQPWPRGQSKRSPCEIGVSRIGGPSGQ